jgi:hypothetical protein
MMLHLWVGITLSLSLLMNQAPDWILVGASRQDFHPLYAQNAPDYVEVRIYNHSSLLYKRCAVL